MLCSAILKFSQISTKELLINLKTKDCVGLKSNVLHHDGTSILKDHVSVEREPKIFIDCEDEVESLRKSLK